MQKIILSIVLSINLLVSGCASIVSNHNYTVNVTSSQPNTSFVLKNKAGRVVTRGTAPTQLHLESSAGYFSGEIYTFETTKDGYENGISTLNSSVSAWYIAGNLVFGGLIGWLIVDPLTGAMFNLPNYVDLSVGPKLPEVSEDIINPHKP